MGQNRNQKRRKQPSGLPAQSPSAVTPLIEAVTADTNSPTLRPLQRMTILESYSGPIVHPAILAGYEDICPGSAQKILDLYGEQVKHRIEMENTVVKGDNSRANSGIWVGATFGFATLAVAAFSVYMGYEKFAIACVVSDFATFGGAFVYGTNSRRKEREAKESIKQGNKQAKPHTA